MVDKVVSGEPRVQGFSGEAWRKETEWKTCAWVEGNIETDRKELPVTYVSMYYVRACVLCIYVCMHVCMYVFTYLCVNVCMYIRLLCMYLYICYAMYCLCIFIYCMLHYIILRPFFLSIYNILLPSIVLVVIHYVIAWPRSFMWVYCKLSIYIWLAKLINAL